MQQLLSGLDHYYSHGVMHYHVKGSNLLIDNYGILKIAHFGLAISFTWKPLNCCNFIYKEESCSVLFIFQCIIAELG